MINKIINEQKSIELKKIASKYNLIDIENNLDVFIITNKDYIAHMLFIGSFSAGKSALLNKYLGKSVLVESQIPETAYATELVFSEDEKKIACLNNGEELDFEHVRSKEDISYLKYFINSETLKINSDYIVVDTPGFDSGLERHNYALVKYIDKGTGYVLVIDSDKGTISESAINFLKEVSQYSDDIAIIINKIDKKLPKDIIEITEHINNIIIANLGFEIPIKCTSIYNDDVFEVLNNIITSFDAQILYDKNITSQLYKNKNMIIDALELIKNHEVCDVDEIEIEIENRKKAKEQLFDSINKEESNIKNKVRNDIKSNIVETIKNDLNRQAESLSRQLLIGAEALQNAILSIIRPVLVNEIEKYSSEISDKIVDSISCFDSNLISKDIKLDEVLINIHNKLNDFKQSGQINNSETIKKIMDQGNVKLKSIGCNKNLYRTVTSIVAITTSVINPILEILIVFLPEIINVVKSIFGKSPQEEALEIVVNQIIPQLINKLKIEIDEPLNEIEQIMCENVRQNIDELIKIENTALQIAIENKKDTIKSYEDRIKEIDLDLSLVREI